MQMFLKYHYRLTLLDNSLFTYIITLSLNLEILGHSRPDVCVYSPRTRNR